MSRLSFAFRALGVVGTVCLCAAASTGCTGAGSAPPTVAGRCGTVTAASGLTLRVLLGTGVTDCALGERVVAAFHAEIAGKQPAGSTRPAAAEVDGWHCVSGPPASGGGTDCESDGRNVQAAVEARE